MAKSFSDLSPSEVLALAISLEEDDARIYGDFAARLKETYPDTAKMLETMRDEEKTHAARLIEMHRRRYGDMIPYIQRQNVKGFITRKPLWLARTLSVPQVRSMVEVMEAESLRFYQTAAKRSNDLVVRALLDDLAAIEQGHETLAAGLQQDLKESGAAGREEETARRLFVLQVIQPGLAGLMDGSVSTLAPVFAAAYATKDSGDAFLVGLAASIGAGISMGFAEALSDDGVLSGRGHPWVRGIICGLMTGLGGIGHTLPFLIGSFHMAMIVAVGVVAVELAIISWIRHKYMDTPLLSAAFQVVVGGVLVFITGIVIGSS
ncbi:MAG: ferritin family protein [Verrucomicrobiota bacterium]|nr:ferritin family protein [Verrucomicrobiota bacterium]